AKAAKEEAARLKSASQTNPRFLDLPNLSLFLTSVTRTTRSITLASRTLPALIRIPKRFFHLLKRMLEIPSRSRPIARWSTSRRRYSPEKKSAGDQRRKPRRSAEASA